MNIGKIKSPTTIPASSLPADPNNVENSSGPSTPDAPIRQRASQELEQPSRSHSAFRKNENHLSAQLRQASLHKQLTENRADPILKACDEKHLQVPQLKMQMIIEHKIKAEQMASNLSKKLQTTAQEIVSKMK